MHVSGCGACMQEARWTPACSPGWLDREADRVAVAFECERRVDVGEQQQVRHHPEVPAQVDNQEAGAEVRQPASEQGGEPADDDQDGGESAERPQYPVESVMRVKREVVYI